MSCTKPADASTRRCFVTAWRVIPVPDVSCVIESAAPVRRTVMRRRRVSSPRAAKMGAELSNDFFGGAFFGDELRGGYVFFNVCHLFVPALAVHAKRFEATRRRDFV